MSEELNISADMPEVADRAETQGAEEQEVAELAEGTVDEQYDGTEDTEDNEGEEPEEEADESGKTPQDAAFAEQRRRIAELEAQLHEKELDEQQRALEEAIRADEAERDAEKRGELEAAIDYAREQGFDDEEIEDLLREIMEEQEQEDYVRNLEQEKANLEDRLLQFEAETQATSDLKEIQKIDPSIKDLDSLGVDFFALRSYGIEPARAYYMLKSADEHTKPQGAKAPGKLGRAKQESEYYSSEEIDNMSKEEIKKNFDKVMRSMDKLSKER